MSTQRTIVNHNELKDKYMRVLMKRVVKEKNNVNDT